MHAPHERTTHRRIDQQLPASERRTPGTAVGQHSPVRVAASQNEHDRPAESPERGEYRTGTTIVAVSAGDGVVMAADRRMSLGGGFTASKDVEKIEQVHPSGAVAISGTVGPAQQLLDSLRAEATLYESRRGEAMSMTALSKTAGHLIRGLPVRPLLGGVDDTGGHVYELDGGGSVIEDGYAASGSGMQLAYGVLEGRAGAGLTVEGARTAAVDAVEAASERDAASGNGVTVATITDEGVEFQGGER